MKLEGFDVFISEILLTTQTTQNKTLNPVDNYFQRFRFLKLARLKRWQTKVISSFQAL